MNDRPDAIGAAASSAIEAGWTLLARGEWADARRCFEDVPGGAGHAQCCEGLSWSAWWLDDAETAFSARRRAYRLYRNEGSDADAARMAIWLAVDWLDFRGAAAVANGWLGKARRLLAGVDGTAECGWLAFMEGYVAFGAGDSDRAVERARLAADIGRRLNVADLQMLGLALEGSALVACASVEAGMRCLDEATATAVEEDAEFPIAGAWACCFLVSACTAVQDYARAFEWCERIAEFAHRFGSRYMLAFCRSEYAAVHLWRGQWREAEALLEAAVEDFSHSRPAMAGGAVTLLAELRRRQDRRDDVERLLEAAGSTSAALLVRARMALDDGDALNAAELAERALRQVPEHRRLQRVPGLQVLAVARIRQRELDAAASAVTELARVTGIVGTLPLRAATVLAEGMLLTARGDASKARPMLEDAVDGFERSGAPYECALARLALAEALMALCRREAAAVEARAAVRSLDNLGALAVARRATAGSTARVEKKPPSSLTAREEEVLRLLADGLTNRRIAGHLGVSEHTIHRHVANILRKLDLPSRAAAAAHAARRGI